MTGADATSDSGFGTSRKLHAASIAATDSNTAPKAWCADVVTTS